MQMCDAFCFSSVHLMLFYFYVTADRKKKCDKFKIAKIHGTLFSFFLLCQSISQSEFKKSLPTSQLVEGMQQVFHDCKPGGWVQAPGPGIVFSLLC